MNIKIVSDGIGSIDSHVITDEGEELRVSEIIYNLKANEIAKCTLIMPRVEIDAFAELQAVVPLVPVCPDCLAEMAKVDFEDCQAEIHWVWLCDCKRPA